MLYNKIMTEITHTPEMYFTARSLAVAQAAGVTAVQLHLGLIAEMNNFIHQETGAGSPELPEAMDFVTYWTGGHRPRQWDTHFTDAVPEFPYYAAEQLPQPTPSQPITKAALAKRNTRIVELQTDNFDGSTALVHPLARAFIFPPHEKARFDAPPQAWGAQIMKALTLQGLRDGLSPSTKYAGNPEVEAEAARRFSGAIVLHRHRR